MGIVLAFQTRKVKIPGLKDSKFVAAVVYISSIVLVALALVTFALRTYINISSGIRVAGIFTMTTMILVLIFVPKVEESITIDLGSVLYGVGVSQNLLVFLTNYNHMAKSTKKFTFCIIVICILLLCIFNIHSSY